MQHLQVQGYRTSFIVSGTGGAKLHSLKPTGRGFATTGQLGFNHIRVTPDELHVQYINTAGQRLHHFRRDQSGEIQVLA